jgi:hypothetical protein
VGKDLWQESEGQNKVFGIRENGKIVRIAVSFPGVQLERVAWYNNAVLTLVLIMSSLSIFVIVAAAGLWRLGRRLFLRHRPRSAPQPGTIYLTWALTAAGNAWVVIVGSTLLYFAFFGNEDMPPTPDWYPWFHLINVATAIAILLSALAAISAWRVWLHDELRYITKVKFSLVGVACVVMCWFAVHWNLIGTASRI